MNADQAVKRIESSIKNEEAKIASSFSPKKELNIDSRLLSLEFTRSLNYHWWWSSVSRDNKDLSLFLMIARGFNSAMAMFMNDDIGKDGVPNAPSTIESKQWADSVLYRLGSLRIAARQVQMFRAQLLEFIDASDDRIRFRTVGDFGVAEDDDFDANHWMDALVVEGDREEYHALRQEWPEIQLAIRKKCENI